MTLHPCLNKGNKSLTIRHFRNGEQVTACIVAPTLIKTLLALVNTGEKGVTALEANSWAFRISSYVYSLRHDYGLNILTRKEEHEGGWHARYVLLTPVTIVQ